MVTRSFRNSTARDILHSIVRLSTLTTTAATEVSMSNVTSEITSMPVLTPSSTQTPFGSVVTPSSGSTGNND